MKPKLLTATNYNTMLNIGCHCGVCFLSKLEARNIKYVVDQKNELQLRFGL